MKRQDLIKRRSRLIDGLKEKDLAGIPWRVAFALQADGWYLRSDIVWHKPNPLPESVKDRPTRAHEYVFLLTKSPRYYYDVDSIREPGKPDSLRKRLAPWYGPRFPGHPSGRSQSLNPKQAIHLLGRNKRTVWTIPIRGYSGNHFATFPEQLVEPCVEAGSPVGGTVLDPFAGIGTTVAVALRFRRCAVGIDLIRCTLPNALSNLRSYERGMGPPAVPLVYGTRRTQDLWSRMVNTIN